MFEDRRKIQKLLTYYPNSEENGDGDVQRKYFIQHGAVGPTLAGGSPEGRWPTLWKKKKEKQRRKSVNPLESAKYSTEPFKFHYEK